MSSNRPLAPAPPGSHGSKASDEKQKGRKNVSAACHVCQVRKLKKAQQCSGVPPCETCLKSKTECIIDAEGDQRRKLNLKRKIDILEDDRQLLTQLLETLRTGPMEYVMELLNNIRSSANVEDIKPLLSGYIGRRNIRVIPESIEADHDVKWLSGQLLPEEQEQSLTHRQRTTMLSVSKLTDIPIVSVPAKPWTNVTDDDSFVSHLISLWITWHLPWYNFIDRDLFVQAMQTRNLQSRLCSPFLVNAILADACFLSDYPEANAIEGDSTSKGEHFWNEAKRLLDKEEGRVSIPTSQGLGIMFACTCAMGKDRMGWVYIMQAAESIKTLRRTESRHVVDTGLSAKELKQLLDRIELAQFNMFVSGAMAFQVSPSVRKASGNLRMCVHLNSHQEEFLPYPHSGAAFPAHYDCIANEMAKIGEVAWDVAAFLFREEGHYTRAELATAVQGWHARLEQWWGTRSKCTDYQKNPIPSILTLHMYYHTIIITIYAFLKTTPPGADIYTLEWAEQAQKICLSSAHAICQLTEIQQLHWGSDPGPVVNAQWITIALCILMEDLQKPESHVAFMKLCRAHVHLAKRWPLALGMVRMVQLTAQRMDDPLPDDVVAHFRDFEERYWRPEDTCSRAFSSRYPNFAVAIRRGDDYVPEDLELDVFLEKWVSLDDGSVKKR